jgi:hypothetical protein
MEKMKKLLALVIMVCLVMTLVIGCGPEETEGTNEQDEAGEPAGSSDGGEAADETEAKIDVPDDGTELVIYSWNEEFKGMMENYYLKDNPLPSGVEISWVINPSEGGQYQEKLDMALDGKEPIDIFLLEADYAKKYVNTDNTLPLTKVGISEDMMKDQYPYTIDVVRDSNGVPKGSSWQATPGLFMYRYSLAEKYLGVKEPDDVQNLVKDWDTFVNTARTVKDKSGGKTKFIPSVNDIWQVIRTVRKSPWVVDNKLVIDDQVGWFMDLAKTLTQEDLTAKYLPWSQEWNAGVGNDTVMGYFFSTWGIQWTMISNCGGEKPGEGTYGDWRAVKGPQPYYWGGTWLAVSPQCDNGSLVNDIIKYFTINKDTMKEYCLGSKDYVNNQPAIQEIIDSGYSFDFLGGQNHYALFQEVAPLIDTSAMSGYDQKINDLLMEQVTKYAEGQISKDQALEDFKKAVLNAFPELSE